MQTKSKLGGIKERIFIHRMLGVSIASLAVFLMTFILVPTLISEASATSSIDASISWSSISLTLDPDCTATRAGGSIEDSGHGDIDFGSIVPTENTGDNKGTMRVSKKTIGVETNGKYFAVYLSMNGTSSTNNNKLNLNGSDSNVSIPAIGNGATTGTWTNPIAFAGSAWGYAVPGSPITNGFDEASSYSAYPISSSAGYVTSDLTALSSNVYNSTKWAAVSIVSDKKNAQMIWKYETNNTHGFGGEDGDNINNHFDIYYATMVDTDTLAGEYTNEIVYTALASSKSLDQVSTNVSRDKAFGGEGDTVHLSFDLAASNSSLTSNNLSVYLVKHSVASTIPDSTLNSSLNLSDSDYTACTSISNVVIGEDGVELDCVIPASIDGILGKGDGYGEFDFLVNVSGYNYNYLSRYKDGNNDLVASFIYAGLQSTYDTEGEESVVTEMQEVSGGVCKSTNMWGTGVGEDAQIYDYLGESGNNALLSTGADTPGISTFTLTDNRDNKNYRIRRLADDNCWMSQNLALNLADFAGTNGLTSRNTDLNSKQVWDPSKSTVEKYTSTYASKLESQGLTKDFSGLTELLLGMAEGAQFQSTEQTGYHWCSRIKDDGSYERDTACRSNTYAEIPRSYYYDDEYGTYYNWYAATAESGRYLVTTSNGVADSVCPFGWQLPGTGGNKGYSTLFVSKYQIASSTVLSGSTATAFRDKIKLLPFTFMHAGNYTGGNNEAGLRGIDANIYIHTSIGAAYNYGASQEIWSSSTTEITLSGPVNSTNGAIVRCVARD